MSNRVQQQQQQKRMDAERMQKAADKQSRQTTGDQADRQQFGQLMKGSANQAQQAAGNQARKKAASKDGDKKGKLSQQAGQKKTQAQSHNVRLARGGAMQQSKVMSQAESFHSMLDAKKVDSESLAQVQGSEAEQSKTETKEALSERTVDLEQKAEEQRETTKQEARLAAAGKGKANAAIEGESSAGEQGDDGEGQNDEAGVDAARKAAERNDVKTENLQGAAGAKQLPPEVVEALVKQVLIGVNADGDATFRIELNDGVLQGASLEVTAKGGKIGIAVTGLDAGAQRLVKASMGQLQRGLEARGLSLDALSVA